MSSDVYLEKTPLPAGAQVADRGEKQDQEKWVEMTYKGSQKVKKSYIGWWGGFLVVEQHVPSGGGAVENEKEVMEAHRGLHVVVVQKESVERNIDFLNSYLEKVLLPQLCIVAGEEQVYQEQAR